MVRFGSGFLVHGSWFRVPGPGFRVPGSRFVPALGIVRADSRGMVVNRYEDLVVWQLARELERKVFAFTATVAASKDFDYCRQIRRSSSSAPRNIAEGFGRYRPAEFARFVRIARGSLTETKDHLDAGLERGYCSSSEHGNMNQLVNRALGASTRLVRYLDEAAETWTKRPRRAKRKNPEP